MISLDRNWDTPRIIIKYDNPSNSIDQPKICKHRHKCSIGLAFADFYCMIYIGWHNPVRLKIANKFFYIKYVISSRSPTEAF